MRGEGALDTGNNDVTCLSVMKLILCSQVSWFEQIENTFIIFTLNSIQILFFE